MILLDVNVLVYAHREDTENHTAYLEWLEDSINSDSSFGISDLVLSGFLRIVTHPRIFTEPTPAEQAIAFIDGIRNQPNCLSIAPGPRHWNIFLKLCRSGKARGNLVPDAYFAALAIESGCEWISTDRDFRRFDGLSWRHPLGQ